MSWCTLQEVVDALYVSRFSSGVCESERRAADERFIRMHETAVNIGDVLTEVAVSRDMNHSRCDELRFVAALALEPLVTRSRWCGGVGFGNKVHVLGMLLGFLRSSCSMTPGDQRVRSSLYLCLCRVISFESPAPRWSEFLGECLAAIVLDMDSEGQCEAEASDRAQVPKSFYHAVMLQLSELCAHNVALWCYMASVVSYVLFEKVAPYTAGDARRHFCFSVVVQLLRHRPGANESVSEERPADSFICGSVFRRFVVCSLQETATVMESITDGRVSVEQECRLLLDVSCYLISDVGCAAILFWCCMRLLTPADSPGLMAVSSARVDSALECLAGVLQVFPEVSLQFDVGETTLMLLNCMANVGVEGRDSDDDEVALLDSLREDYVVPLGCTGGDTVSVASAVLELLVEASPQRISVIVCALCNCCASAGDLLSLLRSARWRAWSTALRCCCRVCEEKKMSLVDSVPEVQSRLLPLFAELLCEGTMLSSAVELIDLLSLTLVGTTQTQLCTAFLSLLDGRFLCCGACCKDGDANEKGSHRLSGQSKLLSISVYAVHRLLSRCDRSIVEAVVAACDVCLWLQRSLFVLASGGPLAVYCGAYAVGTLLSIAPRIASHFPSLAVAAMDSACRHCALPDGSTLVARLLACLCDHEESECTLASELLARFISQCRQASPRRALLLRSISDNTLCFSRLCLRKQKEFAQNENVHMCQRCTLPRLTQCLPVVTLFTADDAPHDEATTRLLSHCLAASASVLVSRDVIVSDVFDSVGSALTALFRSSVGERHSSSTLSTIVAAMSVVALGCPALLDGTGMTGVVLSLFTDGFDPSKGKGVNYVGYCLLPALSCIRNPRQLDGIAAGMAGAPPASDGAPLSVAWPVVLGLWSSVAPFADHFVSLYFLAAWFRLLRYAMSVRSSGVGGFDPITVTASSCCVYALPSLHIKSLPRRRLEGCSIVQCIAVGLSLVLHKGRSVSKPQLLDTEIQDLHCITRRFEALCGGDVDSVGVDLFSTMSVSEGADWLLEQLLAAGYTTEVGTAVSFASKC